MGTGGSGGSGAGSGGGFGGGYGPGTNTGGTGYGGDTSGYGTAGEMSGGAGGAGMAGFGGGGQAGIAGSGWGGPGGSAGAQPPGGFIGTDPSTGYATYHSPGAALGYSGDAQAAAVNPRGGVVTVQGVPKQVSYRYVHGEPVAFFTDVPTQTTAIRSALPPVNYQNYNTMPRPTDVHTPTKGYPPARGIPGVSPFPAGPPPTGPSTSPTRNMPNFGTAGVVGMNSSGGMGPGGAVGGKNSRQ